MDRGDVTRVEARWKGVIELDKETTQAMTLDGMMFFVVAVRVEEMGATRMGRDGTPVRKDVVEVTDARVMVGDEREQAVHYLAATASPEHAEHIELPEVSTPVVNEPEIFVPGAIDAEVEGVIGSIHDYKKNTPVAETNGSGPKVARFGGGIETVETEPVQQVSRGGRDYKDPALKRFMED